MKTTNHKHFSSALLVIVLIFLLSSCNGGKPSANATWSLIKLVTVGDSIENSSTEMVEVKNCGIPVDKTTECSAGTSNDLGLSLNSGGVLGIGAQFTIDGGVISTLGIGQQSGESVTLVAPPDGFIYVYKVEKTYRTINGEMLAQSSSGEEQVVNFNFHSSCSIEVSARDQMSCPATNSTSTDSVVFEVSGKEGWQNTGITVQSGQSVQISFISGLWAGRVGWGPSLPDIWTEADGINFEIYFPDFGITGKFASLIGRIGDDGQVIQVGQSYDFVSSDAGILYLRMFDTDMSDNDGSITVEITVTR